MCNPTQNWSIFFLNVLQVNVQQNVQKNLNCPVKGSLKEIEYFTCPEYRRRILLIKDKFDEPAVLTLYVGNPPCNSIWKTWLEILLNKFRALVGPKIPSIKKCQQSMPACFATHSNTRLVIDCTEDNKLINSHKKY